MSDLAYLLTMQPLVVWTIRHEEGEAGRRELARRMLQDRESGAGQRTHALAWVIEANKQSRAFTVEHGISLDAIDLLLSAAEMAGYYARLVTQLDKQAGQVLPTASGAG